MLNIIWIISSLLTLIMALKPQAEFIEILPTLSITLTVLLWQKYTQRQQRDVLQNKQTAYQHLAPLISEMQTYQDSAPLLQIQHWLFDYLADMQAPSPDNTQEIEIYNHLALGEHLLNRAWSAQLDNHLQAAYQAQQQALSHFIQANKLHWESLH